MQAVFLEVQAGRRRYVVHLVAQGLGLDVHRVVDAGHLVDDERVRSGHVDDHRGVQLGAVGQRDARHPPVGPADVGDLGVEPELAAPGLGRPLQVVAGQLGVAHVAGVRRVQRSDQLALGLGPEPVVLGAARFTVGAVLVERVALGQLLAREDLVGHSDLVEQGQHLLVVAPLQHEQHGARLHVQGVASLIFGIEVVGPVLPVREALVGHGYAVKCRVVGAHDGARIAGRAVPGCWQLVDVQGPPALLGQLEGDGGADHPGADDDCVVTLVLAHCISSGLYYSGGCGHAGCLSFQRHCWVLRNRRSAGSATHPLAGGIVQRFPLEAGGPHLAEYLDFESVVAG